MADSFIVHRQRALTSISPHAGNPGVIVPKRTSRAGSLIVPVFVTQIGAIPNGNVGVPVVFDVAPLLNTTAGVVLTVTAGVMPVGISIVGLTLAGTPSGAEVTAFDITATNPAGADTSSATWTIDL